MCGLLKNVYFVLCVLVTFGFIGFCIHLYLLDADVSLVDYKIFHEGENHIYPSVSICIREEEYGANNGLFLQYDHDDKQSLQLGGATNHDPFFKHLLKDLASLEKAFDGFTYKDFLDGSTRLSTHTWNKSYADIDYDSKTISIQDFIVGIAAMFEDSTLWYNPKQKGGVQMWKPKFYIGKREAHEKCMTFDAPFKPRNKLSRFAILLNRTIWGGKNRPQNSGFAVRLHYPQQVLRSMTKKSYWVDTIEKGFYKGFYTMKFDVQNMVVVKQRNKSKRPCLENWKNDDEEVKRLIMETVGCKPSHWKLNETRPLCNTQPQMEQINKLRRNLPVPSCKIISKVIFTEADYPDLLTFATQNLLDLMKDPGFFEAFGLRNDFLRNEKFAEILFDYQGESFEQIEQVNICVIVDV